MSLSDSSKSYTSALSSWEAAGDAKIGGRSASGGSWGKRSLLASVLPLAVFDIEEVVPSCIEDEKDWIERA